MAEDRPLCDCGRPAALKKVTDASKATYGRWFWGCKNFNDSRKPCRFFEWYDGDEPELGKVSADLQKVPGSASEYRCHLCQQNVEIGGQHVCRAYGTYHCGHCGNCWTSGYSWAGNEQQCRRCGQYQHAESSQPLQRAAGRGTGRPHNSAMCGMCQALGYPCNLAAQPGQPGFVRQQGCSSYGLAYISYGGSHYRPY